MAHMHFRILLLMCGNFIKLEVFIESAANDPLSTRSPIMTRNSSTYTRQAVLENLLASPLHNGILSGSPADCKLQKALQWLRPF